MSEKPKFYEALGHALTRWQYVENTLSAIFIKVSTCSDSSVALAIFYSPRDFNEKLKATHCAARLSLKNALFDEWDDLRKRLIKESEIRNALAHFMLHNKISFTSNMKESVETIFLMPNSFNPNIYFKDRSRKHIPKEFGLQDIKAAVKRFNQIQNDLHAFSLKIQPL